MLEGLQPAMVLGQGGEGTVRLAWDPSLARWLAVKTLRVAGDSAEAGQRLLARFAPFAQDIDPGLAALLACGLSSSAPAAFRERFGAAAGLWLYVVLPYVHGLDAAELGNGRPLPARVVAALGAETAQILERLHARGLAHLDLKPQNVLVDRKGRVVLVDFHAATGAGTSGYAAPEQAGGEGGPAADWFALSRTLLSVWTGEPLEAGRPLPDPPEPAATLSGQERLAHGALAALLERLGSRDAAERQGSAAELERLSAALGAAERPAVLAKLDDIEARQRQKPGALAAPPPRAARRPPFVGLGLAAAAIACAAGYGAWRVAHPRPAPPFAADGLPPLQTMPEAPPAPPADAAPCVLGEVLQPGLARVLCAGASPGPHRGVVPIRAVADSPDARIAADATGDVWRAAPPIPHRSVRLELAPGYYHWYHPANAWGPAFVVNAGQVADERLIGGDVEYTPRASAEWNRANWAKVQKEHPESVVRKEPTFPALPEPQALLRGPLNLVELGWKGAGRLVLAVDDQHPCEGAYEPMTPDGVNAGNPLYLTKSETLWACPAPGAKGELAAHLVGYTSHD